MITRALLVLLVAACPAFGQSGITVMADSNRAVRTNFTLGNAQVTGLSALLDAKLATNGNAAGLTNLNAASVTGTLAISNGGTGSSTASNARTALGLGTAATNAATAFQAASTNLTALASGDGSSLTNITPVTDASSLTNFPAELLRTNGDGSALTGITVDLTTVLPAYSNNAAKVLAVATNETGVEWIAISNTVTDASSLTNFPTLNQNTTGTASNVTGVVAIANGGTGSTNAANARISLLPSYSANGSKVLALNTNATDVEWITITNGGGGTSGVTSIDLSGGTTGLTSSGGPITTSGTLTLGGTLALANGGTGATNASGARTALELGTAATNAATAFQLASTNLDALANNNGANLTNIPISNTVTDASALTNFPTLNQNTTGTASNVTGVVALVNGGTGQTNAASAIEALLPAYTNNATRVLALNSNATELEWVVNGTNGGGGAGTVTSVDASGGSTGMSFAGGPITTSGTLTLSGTLGVGSGGTGGTNAATALHNLGIVQTNATQSIVVLGRNALHGDNINDLSIAIGDNARIGNDGGTGGSGIIVIGVNATNTGDNSGGIAIGRSASSGASGIAFGRDTFAQNSISIGAGSLTTNSPNSMAIGMFATATDSSSSVALGANAANSGATNAVQLGTGTNSTANTIQVFGAGSVTTNKWSALANSTAFGHYVMAAPTNGTANQVLALNSNATAVVWTTNGGGGGLPETPLAISNGGTAATTAQGALTNLTIIAGRRVKIGDDTTNTSNAGITIGGAAAIIGVNSPSVVIGNEAFSSGTESVVIGPYAKNTNAASGVSIGSAARVLNLASGAIALGASAIVSASDAVQIGGGSNATATTLQFRSSGTIDTNEWSRLAALSTYPTTNISVVGTNNTNTLVFSNGILTSVTTP